MFELEYDLLFLKLSIVIDESCLVVKRYYCLLAFATLVIGQSYYSKKSFFASNLCFACIAAYSFIENNIKGQIFFNHHKDPSFDLLSTE